MTKTLKHPQLKYEKLSLKFIDIIFQKRETEMQINFFF